MMSTSRYLIMAQLLHSHVGVGHSIKVREIGLASGGWQFIAGASVAKMNMADGYYTVMNIAMMMINRIKAKTSPAIQTNIGEVVLWLERTGGVSVLLACKGRESVSSGGF